MIKIGLDLHGVIDENPEFFSEFTKSLISSGNEIHILTGPTINEELKKQLSDLKIEYTHLFSIVDYHTTKGTPITYDSRGHAFMDEYQWDKTKAEYCLLHGIQLHLDDSDSYAYFFKTPFARYLSKNKRKHHIPVK